MATSIQAREEFSSMLRETPPGSRYHAAGVLHCVADAGACGLFPSDISVEELGYALHRIVLNSGEEDPVGALLRGWIKREAEWQNALGRIAPMSG